MNRPHLIKPEHEQPVDLDALRFDELGCQPTPANKRIDPAELTSAPEPHVCRAGAPELRELRRARFPSE